LSEEKINITIKIAERTYPLLVLPVDEPRVRSAVEQVNSTLKDLMSKYDGRDMQDYMAMYVLLMMSQQMNGTGGPDTLLLNEQLKVLDSALEKLLK
jgi:cell division protein ZapA